MRFIRDYLILFHSAIHMELSQCISKYDTFEIHTRIIPIFIKMRYILETHTKLSQCILFGIRNIPESDSFLTFLWINPSSVERDKILK